MSPLKVRWRVISFVAVVLVAAGLASPEPSTAELDTSADVEALDGAATPALDTQTVILHPRHDAVVVKAEPDANKGDGRTLRSKSHKRRVSYIKFRVPEGTDPIERAKLRLWVRSDVDSRVTIHRAGRSWTESTITYNNAPNIGPRLGAIDISAGERHWVTVDVSQYVDGPGRYSFAVVGRDSNTVIFSSSEAVRQPRLKLRTSAVPPGGQPEAPIRAAFMYPWFPNAWDQGGDVPFTQFSPSMGLYDSSDPVTIDEQVALASDAGLEAFIASWWGPGHHTDSATDAVLDRIPSSPNPGFRTAVYYEEEGQSDPSANSIASDLEYLKRLFDKPAYLRIDGAPVVFVWADGGDGSGMAARWAQAKALYGKDLHIVLKVYSGFRDDPNQPDSWHQYGPAKAYSEHLPWSAVVSPGFWHANEGSPRLARSKSRFRSDIRQMVESEAFWQLVTSWNEWGEGTSVEPADEFGKSYLNILGDEFGGPPPPPPPTTTSTTTTTQGPPGDGFSFAAGGDFGATTATSGALDAIAASDAEFMLALGDLSYDDASESEWCDYVKGHLGNNFPVELVVGNHEDDDRVHGFIDDFAACLPDRMGASGTYGAEYYFDVDGLARVIMIGAGNDVNGTKYDYEVGNSHYQWLVNKIDGARADGIPWVIVGMHKVCISAGQKPCEVGAELYDMLLDKRIDLILHGHEHNYQRSKQLTCATPNQYLSQCVADSGADGQYTKGAGSVFVVAGATGGSGHYDIDTGDPEINYLAAWQGGNSPDPGRGYLSISVTANRLTFDYVGITTGYTDHAAIIK